MFVQLNVWPKKQFIYYIRYTLFVKKFNTGSHGGA